MKQCLFTCVRLCEEREVMMMQLERHAGLSFRRYRKGLCQSFIHGENEARRV